MKYQEAFESLKGKIDDTFVGGELIIIEQAIDKANSILISKDDYENLQEFIRTMSKRHKHKDDFANAIMSKFHAIMYRNDSL